MNIKTPAERLQWWRLISSGSKRDFDHKKEGETKNVEGRGATKREKMREEKKKLPAGVGEKETLGAGEGGRGGANGKHCGGHIGRHYQLISRYLYTLVVMHDIVMEISRCSVAFSSIRFLAHDKKLK